MDPDPSTPFERDPAYMPSSRSRRSIAKAKRPKDPSALTSTGAFVAVVFAGLALAAMCFLGAIFVVRRLLVASVLAATLLLAGCGSDAIREKQIGVVMDEIALLGSMAQTPGDRSPEHVEAINERTRKTQANARSLMR